MYCRNCGTLNEDDALFCQSCGTKLVTVDNENPTAVEEVAQVESPVEQEASPVEEEVSPVQQVAPPVEEEVSPVQQAAPPVQQTVPPVQAPRNPMLKWVFLLIGEAVCLIALIVAGISIGKNCFDEKHVAGKYFVDTANGEWEKAYNLLDVTESEFINGDMFAKANKNKTYGKINVYQVSDSSSNKSDLSSLLGEFTESTLGKNITITYRLKGKNSDDAMTVNVSKQPTKKYLFFDNWKVSTASLIKSDYRILVPTGASVTLDGIELGSDYLEDSPNEYLDQYEIPELFCGTHRLLVTMDDMEDVDTQIQVDEYSGEYTIENMALKKETVDKLIELAAADMQQIYQAAKAGKNLNTIEDLFAKNNISEMKDSYESLLSYFNESKSKTIKNIDFSNVKAKANGSQIEISFNYNVNYTYTSIWNNETKDKNHTGKSKIRFNFVREEGNWVLSNLGCKSLSY